MGQDSSFCLFSTDWWYVGHLITSAPFSLLTYTISLTPADGPLWKKSKSRNSPQSKLVSCRYVHPPQTSLGIKLVFSFFFPFLFFCQIEELPVRLAHRVKELDELPHNLSTMPSIRKVKNWYAQSFQVSPSHLVV